VIENYNKRENQIIWDGREKFFCDPRNVDVVSVHMVVEPQDKMFYLPSTVLRVNHYYTKSVEDWNKRVGRPTSIGSTAWGTKDDPPYFNQVEDLGLQKCDV